MSMPETADEGDPAGPADNRLALCLSGGGFRAALFHLGALRRLNELGILSKLDTVSSVSGGSILAAHVATRVRPWPSPGTAFEGWREKVEVPFLKFVKGDIRTGPVLRRFLLPWNWFRPAVPVRALEAHYRTRLTDLLLQDLPERPAFVFCATDMVHGVSWVFERRRVGSYLAGYVKPDSGWTLAKAVAASSCFPPVFSPLPVSAGAGGPGKKAKWNDMSVSDGGLYDNLGLQPVERHGTVLVSDGGLPFEPTVPKGILGRAKAYLAISGKQAGAVRKRLLMANLQDKVRLGTYWGVASAVRRYRPDEPEGYSGEFAAEVIARIRTDMDAFSDAEVAVLMNHGYLLAEIAVAVHAPDGLAVGSPPKQAPYPEWLDEKKAREALRDSHLRRWLGRK